MTHQLHSWAFIPKEWNFHLAHEVIMAWESMYANEFMSGLELHDLILKLQ